MTHTGALPQGYLSPQVLNVASFANSSVLKNFDQIRKSHEAFARVARQFENLQEQVGAFARANLKEVLKTRVFALRGREGNYHASLNELLPLLKALRSLLKSLLSPMPYVKHTKNKARPTREPENQNAPPLANLHRLAKAFRDGLSQRGCLER